MFRYLLPVLITKQMNWKEKLDGILLLLVYAVPFLLSLGQLDAIALFFMHEMNILSGWWVLLFIGAYCSFGNFAPFYEIGSALTMDGIKNEIYLLPLIMYNFYFYMWTISLGFLDSIVDLLTGRQVVWAKTIRFVKQEESEPQEEQTAQAGQGVTE